MNIKDKLLILILFPITIILYPIFVVLAIYGFHTSDEKIEAAYLMAKNKKLK